MAIDQQVCCWFIRGPEWWDGVQKLIGQSAKCTPSGASLLFRLQCNYRPPPSFTRSVQFNQDHQAGAWWKQNKKRTLRHLSIEYIEIMKNNVWKIDIVTSLLHALVNQLSTAVKMMAARGNLVECFFLSAVPIKFASSFFSSSTPNWIRMQWGSIINWDDATATSQGAMQCSAGGEGSNKC